MDDYKELVDRLRKAWEPHETDEGCEHCPVMGCSTKGCALLQAADAIENLLADVECRKTIRRKGRAGLSPAGRNQAAQ